MPIRGRNELREPGCRLLVGLVVLLGACANPGGPGDTVEVDTRVILSSPIVTARSGPESPRAVVYVSASPQSAQANRVTVTNRRTSTAMTVRLTDGGFDPVPLAASEGDEVLVSYDNASPSGVTVRRRPPRVVRSSPGPNRTDVPLNVRIEVVFSAPVAPESVDDGMRLRRTTGELVPGEIQLSRDGLTVEILPAAPLDPRSDYVLEVTTGIRDELGSPLQSSVTVPFTTGTEMGPAAPETVPSELLMTPATCCPTGRYRTEGHLFGIEPGTTMVFQVLALGVTGISVAAGTSNAGVASVTPEEPYMTVRGRSPGRVRVSASIFGYEGSADVLVYGPLEVPLEQRYQVVGLDDDGRLATALLNGSRFRVLNDTITDVTSWAPMSAGRLVFSRRSGGILIRERNGALSPVVHSPAPARCVGASRDGAWISWVAAAGSTALAPGLSTWNIMAARVGDRGQARVVVANRASNNCPVWSPGGELVYQGQLFELRSVTPDGLNDRQFMVATSGGVILPAAWSWEADRRLVVENYSIRSLGASGAAQVNLFSYGLGDRASWSTDGRYLLVPQPFGVASGARSFPMRALITVDGLHRSDLPTLSVLLREAAFVPW